MLGLANKNVLITGGTSGIGLATARRFLCEASRVFIGGLVQGDVDRAVEDLAGLGEIHGAAAELADADDVRRFVETAERTLGGIDILINNAGTGFEESFLEITLEHWDRIMAVNLRGMFLVAQLVARSMVEAGHGGAIVNMSSTNGLVGEAGYAHYNASKGGVALLTKTMALELGPHGIRVNALCPGYIRTPLLEAVTDQTSIDAYVKEKIPLGRVGTPEEVAAAYAFLASNEAPFIHGECLVIDGGQLAV